LLQLKKDPVVTQVQCSFLFHSFEVKVISAPNFLLQLLMCYFILN